MFIYYINVSICKMEHLGYLDLEIGSLFGEDRFKKIKFSYDFTDTMSEFLDK